MEKKTCPHCGTEFVSRWSSRFCSKSCWYDSIRPKVSGICGHCGNGALDPLRTRLARRSKSGHIFCNHSCAAKYSNTHKTTGTRRSKLEVWLEERLRERYPDLDIHCNRTDAINGELDIYFPGLKLAFELNGIFHYEPIYGEKNLGRTQTNDARKFAACTERGIELCVIDTSRMLYFKERWAHEHLKVVCEVLDGVIAQRVGDGWDIGSTDPTRGRASTPEPVKPRELPFGAAKLLERAMTWDVEMRDNGWSQGDLAKREGIHVSIVARTMSTLRIPEEMKQKLLSRDPSLGKLTTRQILSLARSQPKSGKYNSKFGVRRETRTP